MKQNQFSDSGSRAPATRTGRRGATVASLLVAVFVAVGILAAASPAQAGVIENADHRFDDSAPVSQWLVSEVEWPPDDWTGWTVFHYDIVNGSVTPGLDAAIPANRDAEAVFAAMSDVAPLSHVSCSVAVTSTSVSGGQLHASTSQHCTGVTQHRTERRFQRDAWNGWHPYTNWGIRSTFVGNNQWLNLDWTTSCGSGGTYNYRMQARPVVSSSHGTQTLSASSGGSTRATCGTGVS